MIHNPYLDDQIRDIVMKYVEPEKRVDALNAIKELKTSSIMSIMSKVNNYVESLNSEVESKLL
jgi:hypothetical protein